jgi:hypothetical protein
MCQCLTFQQVGVLRIVTAAVYERICLFQCVDLQQADVVRSVTAAVYERIFFVSLFTVATVW